jgi:hypothetical protein
VVKKEYIYEKRGTMKVTAVVFCLMLFGSLQAQPEPEDPIKEVIEDFFEGFHSRDTSKIRAVLHPGVRMQRIGRDAGGNPFLKEESVEAFLTSIATLPDTLAIEERLHFYTIQNDGNMANAWTPYTFYVQGAVHHCGVNSFQLFFDGREWKIIYIVDTREAGPCTEPEKRG